MNGARPISSVDGIIYRVHDIVKWCYLQWVQWVYDWPWQRGRHTFRVRATDGTGTLQIEAPHDPSLDGATGSDSVTRTLY
jgi:hypothetical protein